MVVTSLWTAQRHNMIRANTELQGNFCVRCSRCPALAPCKFSSLFICHTNWGKHTLIIENPPQCHWNPHNLPDTLDSARKPVTDSDPVFSCMKSPKTQLLYHRWCAKHLMEGPNIHWQTRRDRQRKRKEKKRKKKREEKRKTIILTFFFLWLKFS